MSDPAGLVTASAPLCPGPDPAPRPPRRFVVPRGAVDTHAHVIGLPPDYPIVPDRNYTPPAAPPEKYLGMLDAVGMTHGVLIQVSVGDCAAEPELGAQRPHEGREERAEAAPEIIREALPGRADAGGGTAR